VYRPVFEQIQWERDCAMQQLKDHGIPFGGTAPDVVKVVRCRDCGLGEPCLTNSVNVWCNLAYEERGQDDFCSYGKRRADDGK
jgi:hypothetical protein